MPKIKELAKCKHPNSRKTNALIRKVKRNSAKQKNKLATGIKKAIVGEKLLWFQDNLGPDCNICTPQHVLDLVEKYLCRFDEELNQIRLKYSIGHRKNHRQHANREDAVKMTLERENKEFNSCGLEIPDLLDIQQFELLKNWDGDLKYLANFKLKRYNKQSLLSLVDKSTKNNRENEENVMETQ